MHGLSRSSVCPQSNRKYHPLRTLHRRVSVFLLRFRSVSRIARDDCIAFWAV